MAAAALVAVLGGSPAAQAPPPAAPYTVLTRDGTRQIPARVAAGQEMFALDDLATLVPMQIREDTAAGGLIVTVRDQTIVLTPGQSLASVGGRLISLPAAPVRQGEAWLVPVDFVSRALAPVAGVRIDLRKPSRLIVVGDLRVPRVAGRVEALGGSARLTLDVAPATPHAVTQSGQRLVIRFEADALDATLPATTAPELIAGVRPGDTPATIAVDLGPRFASFRSSEAPGERGGGRIVVDVIGPATAEPVPAPPVAEPPPLRELAPAGGLRTIVIDPGHGGTAEGARGPGGGLEKHVTLAVARRLKGALESRLGVRVLLTRDGDDTVGLDERAALANNNKADLFLSLHANASVRPAASGAEVFYLAADDYESEAQRQAGAPGVTVPVFGGGSRDIEVIPWELAQVRYIEQSAAFAAAVEAAFRERVPMSPRPLQPAPFRVLVGANMPAILVEMGFITNPEQEKLLGSDAFQNDLVQALVAGIIRYRDSRASVAQAQGGVR